MTSVSSAGPRGRHFWRRRHVESHPRAEDEGWVLQELARLDPWSFWVARVREDEVGDVAVLGTTGAFLISIFGREGYLAGEGERLTVDGRPIGGLRGLRKAAQKAHHRLGAASVFTDVVPLLCLTRAVAGSPRTVKDVRVVHLEDLIGEIVSRERSLRPSRAEKGVRVLGDPLPRAQGARPDIEDET